MNANTRLFAIAAIFLVTAAAGPRPSEDYFAAPPVLVLDRDAIFARYAGAEKAQLTRDLEPLVNTEARRYGAIVLAKSALLRFPASAEMTADIERALDKTHTPRNSSPLGDPAVNTVASRPLVLDRAAAIKFVPQTKSQTIDAKVDALLDGAMSKGGATMILNRSAVVVGEPIFDITEDVYDRLTGRNTKIAFPQGAPVRILEIDRDALLADSKVGKSIGVQVNYLVNQAEADFLPRKMDLNKQADEVKAKASSLSPQEYQAEADAYNAALKSFQSDVELRQKVIEDAVLRARRQIETELSAILDRLMQRHGAQLILANDTILYAPANLDITGETVSELDRIMPDIKLDAGTANSKGP
ncbi:MAG TPA: OmpH family outer membrane protein [Rhizomicrobium sp.]|nr:OmpH family outer membrane protein [Rhizomicrobium sp.]